MNLTKTHLSQTVLNACFEAEATLYNNATLEVWTSGGTNQTPTGTKLYTFNMGADPYANPGAQKQSLNTNLVAAATATGTPALWRILSSSSAYLSGGTVTNPSTVEQIGQEFTINRLDLIPVTQTQITIV